MTLSLDMSWSCSFRRGHCCLSLITGLIVPKHILHNRYMLSVIKRTLCCSNVVEFSCGVSLTCFPSLRGLKGSGSTTFHNTHHCLSPRVGVFLWRGWSRSCFLLWAVCWWLRFLFGWGGSRRSSNEPLNTVTEETQLQWMTSPLCLFPGTGYTLFSAGMPVPPAPPPPPPAPSAPLPQVISPFNFSNSLSKRNCKALLYPSHWSSSKHLEVL